MVFQAWHEWQEGDDFMHFCECFFVDESAGLAPKYKFEYREREHDDVVSRIFAKRIMHARQLTCSFCAALKWPAGGIT